ncbi:hypothetical protein [Solimonas marina]|uniref:ATP-dependent protease HslVU (ClpYQ), peptidase subunit n=1 Tax=Solimonas marina TaxID=2714601 RepID=A0A970B5G4_9GAMM|nr:hypothetical protein [Solimonas marina]NKF21530.1 hypothetical protein [Solimonas marina]
MYMRADSCTHIANGQHVVTLPERKIARTGGYLIGTAGAGRWRQLVQNVFDPPPRPPRQDLLNFLARDFADALHSLCAEYHTTWATDGRSSACAALIGVDGRLFVLSGDFAVVEQPIGYAAIGSGGAYALGALHATARRGLNPRPRLDAALKAAAEFCATVRGPFRSASLGEAS